MKVLLIDVNCKHSSTGKIVYDLYQNLRELGHQAAVCYGRGEKIVEPDIYKFGLDWETVLHAFLARVTGLNGSYSYFSTKRLIRYIDAFKPDVIHIHELHAYFVNIKLLLQYIRSKNIRVVWTFHCEYMYTGKCGHAYACEKWKTECGKCPAIKEYPKSLWFDHTKGMFLQKKELLQEIKMDIVTPSQWLSNRVSQSFLKEKCITIIHNGINTKTFSPASSVKLREKLGIPKENKVILTIAPNIMSEQKGGKWVFELAKRKQGQNLSFVFVGDGHMETTSENIYFIGHISDQRILAQYYSMANVFVICSHRENFPTTCIEAQCCGTPIIGFDEGGTKETSLLGTQYFVPYGELDLLEEALDVVLNEDINRHNLVQMARRAYSREVMFQKYLKLYMQ